MSKLTTGIAGIVIVALAGYVVLQQQKIGELQREIAGLTQQVEQIAPLQEKLDEATRAAADSAHSLSEGNMRDLARLRNEVTQLRQATNELARARQRIDALGQRLVAQEQTARDAEANAAAAQAQSRQTQIQVQHQDACINNLRLIDSAKQQWALEHGKRSTDTPEVSDLQPYIGRGPNGEMPACPDGGTYVIGTVGEKPTCSTPGHTLP